MVEYAGFWRRLVAFLVDAFILSIALYLLNLLLSRVGLPIVPVTGGGGTVSSSGVSVDFRIDFMAPETWVPVLVNWIYFAVMESSPRQATLGKLALSLQVTDLHGARIGFWQATGRYFAKFLSALILMIGFIMAGFTERKQALHDKLAGCLVVRRAHVAVFATSGAPPPRAP